MFDRTEQSHYSMNKSLLTSIICSLTLPALMAQKKPIDHSTYDIWKNITSTDISKSGSYVFYTVSPQEGDGYLELKDKNNKLIQRIDRASGPKITEGEKFLVSTIKPPFKDIREAKIKKKKAEDFPKDSLIVFNIEQRQQIKLGPIKNFKVAQNTLNYIAYTQVLNIPSVADSSKGRVDSTSTELLKKGTKGTKAKKENVLVLQQLSSGDTIQFWKADIYLFSNNEKYLVFNKKTEEKDSSGVDGLYLYDLSKKALQKISNGKAVYKSITFDDQSNQISFLADKSPSKAQIKDFKLYLYKIGQDSARMLIDKNTQGVPKDWYVSGDGQLSFDAHGKKLFFGLVPIPAVKDTTLIEFENAKVDIWHWKDDYLMTQQLVNLKRDLAKNYDAVYNLNTNQLISLIDDTFDKTSYTDAATEEWIMATTTFGNRVAYQWQAYQLQKIYAISTRTGERKLIKSNWNGQGYLSPDAEYIVLFNEQDGNWYSHHIATGTEHQLNKGLSVSFADEENDMPTTASSYGIAAWADNNTGIYINDRYDVWYFSLDGKTKKCITNQFGRNNKLVFRLINARNNNDPRKRTFKINEKTPLFLTSFNETNKENGVFSVDPSKTKNPLEIIQDKFTFKNFSTDQQSKTYIYTKENYNKSPDLYVSTQFKGEQRLTDINPQQNEYNWGTAELVKWVTPNGHPAEGILYKPENFDPTKKYPIIAYFYEKLSQGLYTYHPPAPTPSRLNIPYFVSNEYLVFAPDISYKTGQPGKSAEEYINSGMRHLAQNAWVDSTKMAIQGQSWGGYQVAHLITRTNMYAAAWTGAPVVNMTSAYGGIRWGTGMSRQFQYEKTQSRLGATLWEDRDLYIENSPLFFMDKVNTPVVIMHNDNDGAVPWYQGIEMFTALRRLQKPAWLLNYNGDDHNLIQRQNRKDIQIRQSQFFDHFLKGKPAAEWIKTGVNATKKGINWGLDTK